MADNGVEKTQKATPKSFMTAGPTLHYSHSNVQQCWILALAAFIATCLFWTKLITGELIAFGIVDFLSTKLWNLGEVVLNPLSIFEYPWMILVLGMVMGIFAVVPLLVSQLMSFSYCLPFILAVIFLANLPGLGVCLLVSCIAAACRPLRFRSRIIAIALCMAPQIIYWGCSGSAKAIDTIAWGFSFTPWACAWITGMVIAGLVIGIGHYARYRPGLVWAFTSSTLILAICVFGFAVGFDELDYKLYVAKNNPEYVAEFDDHSIKDVLDETVLNPAGWVKRYFESVLYPTEPIPLRIRLKEEIQNELEHNQTWPEWFDTGAELNYQAKRQVLYAQYEKFIKFRPNSERMPIALYYKALLGEYSPDLYKLSSDEILHFYSDYPHKENKAIWYKLYDKFGESAESIEARWRVAKHYAGEQRNFDLAEKLLAEADNMASEKLKAMQAEAAEDEASGIFDSSFNSPAGSVISVSKLNEIQRRIHQLKELIGKHNRTEEVASAYRLAEFVMLNPHSQDYQSKLKRLLVPLDAADPLRDNVLLAKVMTIADEQRRAVELEQLHESSKDTDGGKQALYELGLLKIHIWQEQPETDTEAKRKLLTEAREILAMYIKLYPDNTCAKQAKKNLDNLPTVD